MIVVLVVVVVVGVEEMEVVYARRGYFCLSEEAKARLCGSKPLASLLLLKRWDKDLVRVVKELGCQASGGEGCILEVVDVAENGGCFVVYPSGEWVFDSLKEAMDDTWDCELDIVNFKYGLTLNKAVHRRYRAMKERVFASDVAL